MHERLIIDGNSVYEVDEECLKRRNVPTECRVKEAVERQIQKEKATKKDSILYAKRMQILHPFLVVHLAAHVSNTNIRRFRRIRFRRHCIRHRITEEESASSSRFRRHCIRIRCCFRRKIHFHSRREEE